MPRWVDLQKLRFIWIGWFVFTVMAVCSGLFFLYTLPGPGKWLGVFFIASGLLAVFSRSAGFFGSW